MLGTHLFLFSAGPWPSAPRWLPKSAGLLPAPARPASTRPAAAGPGQRVPRPAPTPPLGSHGGSAWRTRYASSALTARLERPHPSAASPLLCLLGSRFTSTAGRAGLLGLGCPPAASAPNLGPNRVSNVDEGVGRGGDEGAPLLGSVETGPPVAPGRLRWPSRPASQPVRFGVHGDPPALWQQGPATSCAPRAWPAPARRQAHGAQRPSGRRGPWGNRTHPLKPRRRPTGPRAPRPQGGGFLHKKVQRRRTLERPFAFIYLKGGTISLNCPCTCPHLEPRSERGPVRGLSRVRRARSAPGTRRSQPSARPAPTPLPPGTSPKPPRSPHVNRLCPPWARTRLRPWLPLSRAPGNAGHGLPSPTPTPPPPGPPPPAPRPVPPGPLPCPFRRHKCSATSPPSPTGNRFLLVPAYCWHPRNEAGRARRPSGSSGLYSRRKLGLGSWTGDLPAARTRGLRGPSASPRRSSVDGQVNSEAVPKCPNKVNAPDTPTKVTIKEWLIRTHV